MELSEVKRGLNVWNVGNNIAFQDGIKMSCNCGGELIWLYYAKSNLLSHLEQDSNYVQTDYVMCEECGQIYRQVIETKVIYVPLVTESVTNDTKNIRASLKIKEETEN